MTDDERDALQWVHDCGGSMRAVNNPLSDWLVHEGLVERQSDLIFLTDAGKVLLSPPPTSPYFEFTWAWNAARVACNWFKPLPEIHQWFLQHTLGKTPLIQITRLNFPPHITELHQFGKGLHVAYTSKVGLSMASEDDFLDFRNPLPDNVRQSLRLLKVPLCVVRRQGDVITNRVTGDIDFILEESGDVRTLTAHLWK